MSTDVPPFQVQALLDRIVETTPDARAQVRCAQALGSDIYVGCENGDILRLGLNPQQPDVYQLVSRQQASPAQSPIEEIVLLPSTSRALALFDHQIHFFTLPAFDVLHAIKPIRNAVGLAVDHHHLSRPAPLPSAPQHLPPIEFTVVKRQSLAMFSLRADRLMYQKEIPLPGGSLLARRSGSTLCVAERDSQNYCIVNLEEAVSMPLLPISQAMDPTPVPIVPHIVVCPQDQYLVLSWMGTGTIGVFLTDEGIPTRGTLQFDGHPDAVCLDWPYVVALLPDNSIQVHSAETQEIVQTIEPAEDGRRVGLSQVVGGTYMVPSSERSSKLAKTSVKLVRQQVA